jgi:very-short-patch-repair endonuclease
MRTKIKLSGNPINDLKLLLTECSNNNQICYHIKNNQYLISYLKSITGLNIPVMDLFYHYKEGIEEIPKCICGENRKYHCYGYRPTCSRKKCQSIVREESKKKFCLENYGVEYVTQLDSMKEKSKLSCLEKFGVDNSTKSPDIIKKRRENNIKKYGVSDPIMLKSVRGNDALRGINKIQFGLPDNYQILESDRNYYKILCPKGHKFEIGKSMVYLRKKNDIPLCNQCNEYVGSNGEQDLYNYISSIYSGNISRSNRKLIFPFEIDMVIEDLKLCIEFNGDYWHSDKIVDNSYYHLNKLNLCLMKGYDLIQIRESDWNQNKSEIKRKIYNIINNIFDINDSDIKDNILLFDLSWHDSKVFRNLDMELCESIDPQLIKVGQYNQWDCGYKVYRFSPNINI